MHSIIRIIRDAVGARNTRFWTPRGDATNMFENRPNQSANPSPLIRTGRAQNMRMFCSWSAHGPFMAGRIRLTAGCCEKHQFSTCCYDFRNRAAWNPYKTSKNTRFFYWFTKNAARNRVRPGRGEPCLLSRFPHFPRCGLEPIQNYRKHSVFSAVHRKAYQKSSLAGTVEARLLSRFPYFPRLRPPETFKNTVFLHVLGKIGPTQDNIPSIPRITGLIRINVRHGCGRCR